MLILESPRDVMLPSSLPVLLGPTGGHIDITFLLDNRGIWAYPILLHMFKISCYIVTLHDIKLRVWFFNLLNE